jgi:hypothetical protein
MSFQLEASLSFMSKTTRPFRIPSPSQQAYCRSQQASIVFRASLPSQNISSWQGSNAIQSVEVQTGVTVPWSCEQDLPHREINPIRPPQGSTNTIYQASPKERQPVNNEWGSFIVTLKSSFGSTSKAESCSSNANVKLNHLFVSVAQHRDLEAPCRISFYDSRH